MASVGLDMWNEFYDCTMNPGTHGVQYHLDLLKALLIHLKLAEKPFKLAIDAARCNNFDDAVLIFNDTNVMWLFQCKHGILKKPISHRELFETKGHDFDLRKYLVSYFRIKQEFPGHSKFFFFTNRTLNESNLAPWVRIEKRDVDEMMNLGGSHVGLVPVEENMPRMMDVFNEDFNNLQKGLIELFDSPSLDIPERLGRIKAPLAGILEITDDGSVKFVDEDYFVCSKLYGWLKSHFSAQGKDIQHVNRKLGTQQEHMQKLINGDKRQSIRVYIQEDEVRNFFKELTFCIDQPENLMLVCEERMKQSCRFSTVQIGFIIRELEKKFDDWKNEPLNQKKKKRYLTSTYVTRCWKEIIRNIHMPMNCILTDIKKLGAKVIEAIENDHMVGCEFKCITIAKKIRDEVYEGSILWENNESLLHRAAEIGHDDMIVTLLDSHHFDVDDKCIGIPGFNSYTALHFAAYHDHVTTMKLLLEHGAQINAHTSNKWVALHICADRGQPEAIQLLIQNKADVNARNDQNNTPLHLVAQRALTGNEQVQLLKLFVDNGADLKARNENGRIPLHIAVQKGNNEFVEASLSIDKTLVSIVDKSGYTPLHIAVHHGRKRCAKVLLDLGADANARSNKGRTPLGLAKRNEHAECEQLLIDHGATTHCSKAADDDRFAIQFDLPYG